MRHFILFLIGVVSVAASTDEKRLKLAQDLNKEAQSFFAEDLGIAEESLTVKVAYDPLTRALTFVYGGKIFDSFPIHPGDMRHAFLERLKQNSGGDTEFSLYPFRVHKFKKIVFRTPTGVAEIPL